MCVRLSLQYDPSLPASHTEIKKVLKYRTKEFGFIWRSIANGYDECVETELETMSKTAIWEQWTKEATTIPLFNLVSSIKKSIILGVEFVMEQHESY